MPRYTLLTLRGGARRCERLFAHIASITRSILATANKHQDQNEASLEAQFQEKWTPQSKLQYRQKAPETGFEATALQPRPKDHPILSRARLLSRQRIVLERRIQRQLAHYSGVYHRLVADSMRKVLHARWW